MESSLARAGLQRRSVPHAAVWRIPAKVLARLGLVRPILRRQGELILVPSMGFAEYRLIPHGYLFETVLYVFDCWPSLFPRWEAFFFRHRPRLTFFSARDAAGHFRGRIPGMEAVWMPEATEPERYDSSRPLRERTLDVVELGRRDPAFHDAIREPLRTAGRSHRYEPVPGQIIFPTFAELVEGLGGARISVCFPSSVTHPARSGSVETVTHRYFESMASRCLILGQCPAELRDLFGYDPVIPADAVDPGGHILEILGDVDAYQPLVDRNYARLLKVGTWDVRVGEMLAALDALILKGGSASAPGT